MENLSPVIFFIIYLAISAWAKNRKAQAKKAPMPPPPEQERAPIEIVPEPKVSSIFDQIKKELLDMEEGVSPFIPPGMLKEEPQPEPLVVMDAPQPADAVIEEGSSSISEHRKERAQQRVELERSIESSRGVGNLDTLLESYNKIEQGIVLSEILGKPRAMQANDKWFHSR
jgi:hypothetical protein